MSSIPRIVSVEDDVDIFNLIKLILKPLDIELYHALNGHQALEMTENLKPDLLLLDLALPDIYGWELLNKIRSRCAAQPKGVVVISAHAEVTPKLTARQRDVDEYFNKPFIPADLRNKVRLLLHLP